MFSLETEKQTAALLPTTVLFEPHGLSLFQVVRGGIQFTWDFAMLYSGLGDLQQWRNALTAAYGERDSGLVYLGVWPFFDAHRSDPFFGELGRRIGLP